MIFRIAGQNNHAILVGDEGISLIIQVQQCGQVEFHRCDTADAPVADDRRAEIDAGEFAGFTHRILVAAVTRHRILKKFAVCIISSDKAIRFVRIAGGDAIPARIHDIDDIAPQ